MQGSDGLQTGAADPQETLRPFLEQITAENKENGTPILLMETELPRNGRPSSPPGVPVCQPLCQLAPDPQCLGNQPDCCRNSTGHACESCLYGKKSKTKTKKKKEKVEERSCLSCSSTTCHLPCVLALLNSHETSLYNTGARRRPRIAEASTE